MSMNSDKEKGEIGEVNVIKIEKDLYDDGKVISSAPSDTLDATTGESKHFWNRVLRRTAQDPDSIATQPSVFDNPDTLELYRPPPTYENAHRFDPEARWTWREEQVTLQRTNL